jgi:hypothetical protein
MAEKSNPTPFSDPFYTRVATMIESHPQSDESPQAVVESFIRAMNAWELEATNLSRQCRKTSEPEAYWPEIKKKLAVIHEQFLSPRKRVYASEPSFQRPPAYDPQKETIVLVEVESSQARVETHRKAMLGGGQYRYLLQKTGGKWLIDSVKYLSGEKWKRHIP